MLTPDGIALQLGKEADFVRVALEHPQVTAAFERSAFAPGYIYVEASSLMDVTSVILGMAGVSIHQHIQSIPVHERASLLNLGSANTDLGQWARVCGKGKYHDDLAHILTVNLERKATVLLVPRISSDEEDNKGKRKLVSRKRPSPSVLNLEGKRNLEVLELGRVRFNGQVYRRGLLESTFPLTKLRVARPSVAELRAFGQSGAIPEPIMTKAWSDFSAAAVVPGNRVRIISGEQVGLVGKVLDVGDDVVSCVSQSEPSTVVDVPVAIVRLHLEVGDYVEVNVGDYTGLFGAVITVKRDTDTDFITFVDDMSIKTGQPQEVSFRAVLHDFSSSTFVSFRSHCQHSSSRYVIGPSNQYISPTQMFRHRKTLLCLTRE
jgi:hypothetical protein